MAALVTAFVTALVTLFATAFVTAFVTALVTALVTLFATAFVTACPGAGGTPRLGSNTLSRHRATGHVRHDPRVRPGGPAASRANRRA